MDKHEINKISVFGGGHKYVKLQHVQELIKLMNTRDSFEWWSPQFGKYDNKVKTTIDWVERNAKTKEEL